MLKPRKLLTLRDATVATTAEFARVGYTLGTLCLLAALFAGVASAQQQPQTFRIPFHTVNGMILLDATVNGKPAALLLDTGANNTIISAQAAGLATVQFRSLQATKAGTGAEGDYITRDVDLRLSNRHWIARRVLVMDLSDASKRMGTYVDGFLGQDILREFASVRIDYKAQVLELEQ